MIRQIVHIDEDKCDGCGLCVPSCAEGAIQIIEGKARLVSDRLCDGLGACLGHCPQGAITVEKREAAEFDEHAVAQHIQSAPVTRTAQSAPVAEAVAPKLQQLGGCPSGHGSGGGMGGCPSARFNRFAQRPAASPADPVGTDAGNSELTHWPVQLHLLSPNAPVVQNAHLLLCADCVPIAYPHFHRNLLRGRAVVVACPKLDDPTGYVEKLAAMIESGNLLDITVARMEVPCCMGLVRMAVEARRRAGRDIPINEVVISTQGEVLSRQPVPGEMQPAGRD